jgi:hypothetical protein
MAALWSSVRNTKGDVAGRSQMGGEADSRSQWNARYGADSGPSRADTCRCSVRPTEAFKAAVCFVRFTSTPAVSCSAVLPSSLAIEPCVRRTCVLALTSRDFSPHLVGWLVLAEAGVNSVA